MGFFKKYNGTTNTRLLRLERVIWVAIYGGLLAVVLGSFMESNAPQDAHRYYIGGGLSVMLGAVLLYVRSRLREEE